jgi:prevent-host-death family protein
MSKHSVAEAKNQLSDLINRALQGEDVVITRHGRPVVELTPIPERPRAVTAADLDWLKAHRIRGAAIKQDAGRLLTEIRDDDERR